MVLKSVSIGNYRSIREPLSIPLSGKINILVGQNNSGKSNILRALAIIFNNANSSLDDYLDFSESSKEMSCFWVIDKKHLAMRFGEMANMKRYLQEDNEFQTFTVKQTLSKSSSTFKADLDIFKIIPEAYFSGQYSNEFLSDFNQSDSPEVNLLRFSERLAIGNLFQSTVYVPSNRFIMKSAAASTHFGQIEFPSQTISLNGSVNDIGRMYNPNGHQAQRQELESRLEDIAKFVGFCLEQTVAKIRVPHDNETIFVTIDGKEQKISNLGTGIEQLLLFGLAIHGFQKKIILIEEPELHFHPRTQKRMMRYFQDEIDAKFFITTHSAAILDAVPADIIHVKDDRGHCVGKIIENDEQKYEAVRNLGHRASELIQANFVIWVEGPSDRIYINHWIGMIDPTLNEGTEYTILTYGGAVLARHSFDSLKDDMIKALGDSDRFVKYIDIEREADRRRRRGQSTTDSPRNHCRAPSTVADS